MQTDPPKLEPARLYREQATTPWATTSSSRSGYHPLPVFVQAHGNSASRARSRAGAAQAVGRAATREEQWSRRRQTGPPSSPGNKPNRTDGQRRLTRAGQRRAGRCRTHDMPHTHHERSCRCGAARDRWAAPASTSGYARSTRRARVSRGHGRK